ncbi:uncharacterized protein BYT42DRAFT_568375 [Radiomyces spectabilis]|uniref:uncharacterized protein n=1 Tax=Radiomyces spectabilis TaxID=64574 RepID=UPI00221FFB9B|nr:uncharacterized protein BYT42DRAFT_568375 [Radiomyces spectabilis]KAI8379307.1 hypothetical protein BYT42DRAFT_568375 [Radiomyces spectabilis]
MRLIFAETGHELFIHDTDVASVDALRSYIQAIKHIPPHHQILVDADGVQLKVLAELVIVFDRGLLEVPQEKIRNVVAQRQPIPEYQDINQAITKGTDIVNEVRCQLLAMTAAINNLKKHLEMGDHTMERVNKVYQTTSERYLTAVERIESQRVFWDRIQLQSSATLEKIQTLSNQVTLETLVSQKRTLDDTYQQITQELDHEKERMQHIHREASILLHQPAKASSYIKSLEGLLHNLKTIASKNSNFSVDTLGMILESSALEFSKQNFFADEENVTRCINLHFQKMMEAKRRSTVDLVMCTRIISSLQENINVQLSQLTASGQRLKRFNRDIHAIVGLATRQKHPSEPFLYYDGLYRKDSISSEASSPQNEPATPKEKKRENDSLPNVNDDEQETNTRQFIETIQPFSKLSMSPPSQEHLTIGVDPPTPEPNLRMAPSVGKRHDNNSYDHLKRQIEALQTQLKTERKEHESQKRQLTESQRRLTELQRDYTEAQEMAYDLLSLICDEDSSKNNVHRDIPTAEILKLCHQKILQMDTSRSQEERQLLSDIPFMHPF